MPSLTPQTAHDWIARWDLQQEGYLPDREERFTALVDAVEAAAGRPDPLVLDLGCGPGSLAVRLLSRLPRATVIALDVDPLLLSLGRSGYSHVKGLRFTDVDLRVPGWSGSLELSRPADVAVSTTALHWLSEENLRSVYTEVLSLLRPGGILLNGDHMQVEDENPVLSRLERALHDTEKRRKFNDGPPEDWEQWWAATASEPALAGPLAERARVFQSTGADHSESLLLSIHLRTLREAGFAEIGTLWQRGDNRLLAAVAPGTAG
ncbi:class I SAM-dependent methyltransferase [Spongiactinospora sp. TRM90649]|uniref:class I SAM-dependent methyltransferase n=1 Tax=Spongiactinospora sp. TRM90649 TaxID=3031114 RepID=UPI0023F6F7FA|nr:class I SAM-dependent methyltransferase [Spongiactinospora sp. TRM90649]MDF5757901.1 class I SAM-dependent methyltransferase [Spongiactinospora sp. TRM90649]